MKSDSVTSKLSELFELYSSGALSKDEYDLLKSQLIIGGESQGVKNADSSTEPASDSKNKKKANLNRIAIIVVLLVIVTAVAFVLINKSSKWNESRATKKIMTELNSYSDWASETYRDSSIWYHHLVGFKQLNLNENVMIAITLSNEDENSDSYGWLSIFEFDESKRWKLVQKGIAFAQGENSSAMFDNLHKIAPDNYGFEIQWDEAAMGRRYGISKQIFSFINEEFKIIFFDDRGWYNPSRDPVFTLEFVDNGHAYYDIEATDNDNDRSNGRIRTLIYKFNGNEYVRE